MELNIHALSISRPAFTSLRSVQSGLIVSGRKSFYLLKKFDRFAESIMEIFKIPHNQQGEYTVFVSPDFEFVNPIKYFSESMIQINMTMEKKFLESKNFPIEKKLIDKILFERASKEWEKRHRELINIEIPRNFISLLGS